jgi:hypothetical protein
MAMAPPETGYPGDAARIRELVHENSQLKAEIAGLKKVLQLYEEAERNRNPIVDAERLGERLDAALRKNAGRRCCDSQMLRQQYQAAARAAHRLLKAAAAGAPSAPARWPEIDLATFLARAIKAEEADEAYAAHSKARQPDYREHLQSRYWQRLRAFAAISQNWKCAHCGDPAGLTLELHHCCYLHLGYETLEDVEALCRACHRAEHGLPAKKELVSCHA